MDGKTRKVLTDIMEQCRDNDGILGSYDASVGEPMIEWLFNEGYLWSHREPIKTLKHTCYEDVMPTGKAYRWEKDQEKGRQKAEHQAAEIEAYAEDALKRSQSELAKLAVLKREANRVGEAWCGSSLGDHANVYYDGLVPVPAGAIWDVEWGKMDCMSNTTCGEWTTKSPVEIKELICSRSGMTESSITEIRDGVLKDFESVEGRLLTCLEHSQGEVYEETRTRLIDDVKKLGGDISTASDVEERMARKFLPQMSRDARNMSMGLRVAGHLQVLAAIEVVDQLVRGVRKLGEHAGTLRNASRIYTTKQQERTMRGSKVFIGHGRSDTWRAVKDFVEQELELEVEEFERESVVGRQIKDRLEEMLRNAGWAILVATRDDSGDSEPRPNVIHELGFAQGRLGWEKAIILLEKGCQLPSNLEGTVYLEFERGQVKQVFYDLGNHFSGNRNR